MNVYTGKIDKGQLMVTKSQIALIHVAKKELKLPDQDYRSILKVHGGGVESAKELTKQAFKQVMRYLSSIGFGIQQHAPSRDPNGEIFPAQLKTIEIHFKQLGYLQDADKARFCQRVIKKDRPETRSEANKIFEALKAMKARKYQQQ